VAVPFRDSHDDDRLGVAGFLRFVDESPGRAIRGALFLINARGEPIDFAFTRVEVPIPFMWRSGEARRQALKELCVSLFTACPGEPRLLLARADEVPALLFSEDLEVLVPVCRVSDERAANRVGNEEVEDMADDVHLFWVAGCPPQGAPARSILNSLSERKLLLEPFDRAARGIDEAFRTSD